MTINKKRACEALLLLVDSNKEATTTTSLMILMVMRMVELWQLFIKENWNMKETVDSPNMEILISSADLLLKLNVCG